jgi:isopentenyl diphosphate isomerase/L-lactate dehydrogenase-like FMN-dependent dehydrogenase
LARSFSEVRPGVWCFVGNGLSNQSFIDAPEGIIAIDTGESIEEMNEAIADAVGSQIDVLLDGGVRRGSDVVKAMALGARAVMIGRAYLWGLAANGQAGVENVLDVIRGGIDSALLGLGKSHVNELTRDDVVAPPDFFRKLGA